MNKKFPDDAEEIKNSIDTMEEFDTLLNTLFDKVLTLSMTDEEKTKISERFVFEKISPFYTPHDNFPKYTRAPHVWYEFFMSGKFVAGALSALILLGGGTSFAARSAIPGDMLYPIKIHINEGTESFFSIGVKSTAKTNATHAISRLKEIEKLALQDKLSTTTVDIIKAKFVEEAESVAKNVEKLSLEGDNPGATEVGMEFQTSLEGYQDALTTLSEKGGEQGELLSDIVGTVATHVQATAAVNFIVGLASGEVVDGNITTAVMSTTTPVSTTTSALTIFENASTTATSTSKVNITTATSTVSKATTTDGAKPLKKETQ